MLKIRPISGDLETSLSKVSQIPSTLMALFVWLKKNVPDQMKGNHYYHEDIVFVKHGHETDAEWGNGYLVYLGTMPVAFIDQAIELVEEQRKVWDDVFDQMRKQVFALRNDEKLVEEPERRLINTRLSEVIAECLSQQSNASNPFEILVTRDHSEYTKFTGSVSLGYFSPTLASRYVYFKMSPKSTVPSA